MTFGIVGTRLVLSSGATRRATPGAYRPPRQQTAGARMIRMPTLFSRIIDGEIPGTFVWEDDRCVAFLSINPLTPGHTLVVPRDEVDHWIDLPDDLARHLMSVARTIGRAQQQAFVSERVAVIIAGYEIPHTHLQSSPPPTWVS